MKKRETAPGTSASRRGSEACVTGRWAPFPRLHLGSPKTCVGSAPRRLPKRNLGAVSRLLPGNYWTAVTPKRKRNEAFMKQDSIARFISRLETLGGIAPDSIPDRRALAALRRSLATWPSPPAD